MNKVVFGRPVRLWSEEDIEALTNYYKTESSETFSVPDLAKRLSRTEDAVTLKAGRLGLTKKNRPKSNNAKCKMSASQKEVFKDEKRRKNLSESIKKHIKENGHPRNALGMKHSEKAKKAISESSKKTWEKMDEKTRIGYSQRASILGKRVSAKNRGKSSWKAGWRNIGGQRHYFRSRWEANYARYLEWLRARGGIAKWEYEPETFWFESIKRGVRSYLPDFKVTENSGEIIYHEVKGWMDARSKTTLSRMAKYHPEVTLIVIREKQYREISRKIAGLINDWE